MTDGSNVQAALDCIDKAGQRQLLTERLALENPGLVFEVTAQALGAPEPLMSYGLKSETRSIVRYRKRPKCTRCDRTAQIYIHEKGLCGKCWMLEAREEEDI